MLMTMKTPAKTVQARNPHRIELAAFKEYLKICQRKGNQQSKCKKATPGINKKNLIQTRTKSFTEILNTLKQGAHIF